MQKQSSYSGNITYSPITVLFIQTRDEQEYRIIKRDFCILLDGNVAEKEKNLWNVQNNARKYFQEHFLFISSRSIFQASTRAVTAALQRPQQEYWAGVQSLKASAPQGS